MEKIAICCHGFHPVLFREFYPHHHTSKLPKQNTSPKPHVFQIFKLLVLNMVGIAMTVS